jgi:hypothetical protein
MRKNAAKVIIAFQNGNVASGDTITTDGTNVYSYALLIGFRGDDGSIYVLDRKNAPSVTTRSHVRALEVSFPGATRFGIVARRTC